LGHVVGSLLCGIEAVLLTENWDRNFNLFVRFHWEVYAAGFQKYTSIDIVFVPNLEFFLDFQR